MDANVLEHEFVRRDEFQAVKADVHNLKLDVWGMSGDEKNIGIKAMIIRLSDRFDTWARVLSVMLAVFIVILGALLAVLLKDPAHERGWIRSNGVNVVTHYEKPMTSTIPNLQ